MSTSICDKNSHQRGYGGQGLAAPPHTQVHGDKSSANVLSGEQLEAVPLWPGVGQGTHLSTVFNAVVEVRSRAVGPE